MDSLTIALSILALVAAFSVYRKAIITHGVTFFRETGADERTQYSVNFTIFDTEESMKKKLDTVHRLSQTRKDYTHKVYFEAIEKAQKEQEEAAKKTRMKPVS